MEEKIIRRNLLTKLRYHKMKEINPSKYLELVKRNGRKVLEKYENIKHINKLMKIKNDIFS
jgi:hypothetical protein